MRHRLGVSWTTVAWALVLAAGAAWAAEQPPGAARRMLQQGVARLEAKAYDEAAALFRKAIDAGPAVQAEARLYLGRVLLEQRRWDEAVAELEQARRLKLPRGKDIEAQLDLTYIAAARRLQVLGAEGLRRRGLSVRLEVAGDYQTELALPREVDPPGRFRRDADFRLRTALDVGYRLPLGPGHLGFGYGFLQTVQATHHEIDLQVHAVSTRYSWEPVPKVTAAARLDYTHYLLDEESLVSRTRVGGSIYFPETSSLFGRIAYDLSAFDHRLNDGQDGISHTVSIAQILRLPDPRSYLSLGYSLTSHHPDARRLSFESHGPALAGRWALTDRDWLTGSLAYDWALYDDDDPTEERRRRDEVLSLSLRFTHALNAWWRIYVGGGWTNSDSNLSRQGFDSILVSVGTIVGW